MPQALLALEDGSVFTGLPLGHSSYCVGELVFNTAMSGYQEILTDPSYTEQILTFTYPQIGNVGCNAQDTESQRIHAAGLVVRELSVATSNWRSETDLNTYCQSQQIVGISEIDTRHLTHILRDKGCMHACISHQHTPNEAIALAQGFQGLSDRDLASQVSTPAAYQWQEGLWNQTAESTQYRVVVIDFGVKQNILRHLVHRGCEVWVLPASSTLEDIQQHQPHGVVLSNGPGDPAACTPGIQLARQLLAADIPLLGICLGFQILALAAGMRTVKMKFGHHGSNHPIQDARSQRVLITSQNHNYCLDETSLTAEISVTHRSLFDHTIQGFRYLNKPILAFQGHPEAGPGPHEFADVFTEFVALLT